MNKKQNIIMLNHDPMRILIVSGDRWLSETLSFHFSRVGFYFCLALCEKEALTALQSNVFHIALLDMAQGAESSFHTCSQLKKSRNIPFIFINGSEKYEHIAQAFAMGCDDYLLRPVNPALLIAKLHASAPRYRSKIPTRSAMRNETVSVGNLFIDCKNHIFRVSDKIVALSPTEFSLLLYFYDNLENLVSYSEIYASVWNEPDLNDYRTVMVHVSNLRRKMGCGCPFLKTIRNTGYILTENEG